jgi:hypothetical protein
MEIRTLLQKQLIKVDFIQAMILVVYFLDHIVYVVVVEKGYQTLIIQENKSLCIIH